MAKFNYGMKRRRVLEDRIVNEAPTHRKGHHKLKRGVPPSGMKRRRPFWGSKGPSAGYAHLRPTGVHKRIIKHRRR